MLSNQRLVAFISTRDVERAKAFYGTTLGLPLIHSDPVALVYGANGTKIRIQVVKEVTPHPFTALGWDVENMETTVRSLMDRGVTFERFPGMVQDDLGIWKAPSGTRVVWFKDPEGHLLSLSHHD